MTAWEEYALKRIREIVKSGWGKGEWQVQGTSDNKTSILIIAGETKRFIIDKQEIED